jgi:hypothetical protein
VARNKSVVSKPTNKADFYFLPDKKIIELITFAANFNKTRKRL